MTDFKASPTTAPTDLELFTSLRYDPALKDTTWNHQSAFMLEMFHVERLREAARQFGWQNNMTTLESRNALQYLHSACRTGMRASGRGEDQAALIRIVMPQQGELHCSVFEPNSYPYDLLSLSSFNPVKEEPRYPEFLVSVYLDTCPTPSSIYTSYKTTHRDHYNAARSRASITSRKEKKEVILFNEDGLITESSVCNVAFWRKGQWATPPLDSGCLPGTVRRWMLENGCVVEGNVHKDAVRVGEYVLLSNSWNGVQLGRMEDHPLRRHYK